MFAFTVHDPIRIAADSIFETGGVTIDVRTSEQPTAGYAVAVPDCEYVVDFDTCDVADTLVRYVNAHSAALSVPGAHLGAWVDVTDTGRELYLDVSVIVPDLDDAIALGHANDQLAIFDLNTGMEFRLSPVGAVA